MVPNRLITLRALRASSTRLPMIQKRTFLPESIVGRSAIDKHYSEETQRKVFTELEDPEMNGGYINPPYIKHQFRDPYGDWWDKQERRNFGEPIHEDNDRLAIFSPYEYTWTTAGKGAVMFAAVTAVFLAVISGVSTIYPDRKSYPREFEGGLERELGGPGAKRARMAGDPDP
ncbi:hypothetical protein BROUX41_006666 [Berkeleyomyces rouxiae]|uniref:uncharacterized protein n=1 Tax=Berkeleyomyces rouxiae TaxID=2035830 RepID=UPI003B7FB02F